MYDNCSRCSKRLGLTLIEVITSLAILSTLLVSTLLAFQQNADRIRAELAVRRATVGTERLLLEWAACHAYPPVNAAGQLPGTDDLVWRTRTVAGRSLTRQGLVVVQLDVHWQVPCGDTLRVLSIELPAPGGIQDVPRGARP